MDTTALITEIRNHYVDQFRAFAADQRTLCKQGASEVKLRLSPDNDIFNQLYCADFISNEGDPNVIELCPDRFLSFDPLEGQYGAATLSIQDLRWDDVLLRHDLETLSTTALEAWFERWFDPDDKRHEQGADISSVIHSLLIEPRSLSIDFGTAQPEALWEMLDLLEGAGASRITISSSRGEAEEHFQAED